LQKPLTESTKKLKQKKNKGDWNVEDFSEMSAVRLPARLSPFGGAVAHRIARRAVYELPCVDAFMGGVIRHHALTAKKAE
jgi:hypothetical protein